MRPDFSVEKKQLTAAQAGTAMHLVMEKLDFRQALSLGKGYIRQVAEELHRDQRLSDEEMEAVDIDNIDAFSVRTWEGGPRRRKSCTRNGNSYPAEG